MEGRLILTDAQWAKIEPLCTRKTNDRGPTADNRLFIEAVLWIARTGSPWQDLPKEFGKWNSVFQRYRRWGKAGRFTRIFEEISGEADMEYAIIDGSIVVDALGNLVGLCLLPEQRHDICGVEPLIKGLY